MNNDVAVLVGNGLSIAFNPDLNLQTITKNVLRRIEAAEGAEVVLAMQEIAQRALPNGAKTDEDFEVLVGAFGAESRTLGLLGTLAELTEHDDRDLKKAIDATAKFAEKVRDTGVSCVLEEISDKSNALDTERAESLDNLIKAIVEAFEGKVVISNLNYDTILLNALIKSHNSILADLANGANWQDICILDSGIKRPFRVPILRTSGNFPGDRRIYLIHLHGCISFWLFSDGDEGTYVKLHKEVFKFPNLNLWEKVRSGEIDGRPVVVLASRKDKVDHVNRYPFSLAYEVSAQSLQCDKWLIIGYSFRDDPINNMLRSEFLDRKRENKPRVLVVTYGEELKLRDVEKAFGWGVEDGSSSEWLTINREGASDMENTEDWVNFVVD